MCCDVLRRCSLGSSRARPRPIRLSMCGAVVARLVLESRLTYRPRIVSSSHHVPGGKANHNQTKYPTEGLNFEG